MRLLLVEPRRSSLIFIRHGPEPLRSFAFELVGGSAATLGMIPQSLLLQIHGRITQNSCDSPDPAKRFRLPGPSPSRPHGASTREKSARIRNGRAWAAFNVRLGGWKVRDSAMLDASQLATAAIAVAFAAVLLVTGHWFVDSQLQRDIGMIAVTATIFP